MSDKHANQDLEDHKQDMKRPKISDDKLSRSRDMHCKVERNRRQKLSSYMEELFTLLPEIGGNKRPDKLTLLKFAVDHLKRIQQPNSVQENINPGFLNDEEMQNLAYEATDGFMLVVSCMTGIIVHVADQISKVLNYSREEWQNSSIYEKLHPEDIKLFKEQLVPLGPLCKEYVNMKKGKNIRVTNESNNWCRDRRFICRMKMGVKEPISMPYTMYKRLEERLQSLPPSEDQQYIPIHCSGIIIHNNDLNLNIPNADANDIYFIVFAHLKDTLRKQNKPTDDKNEFTARLSSDYTFTFVDTSVRDMMGYSPSELLRKSIFDFVHEDYKAFLRNSVEIALKLNGQMSSINCLMRNMDMQYVQVMVTTSAFVNPYNMETEFVVCKISLNNNEFLYCNKNYDLSTLNYNWQSNKQINHNESSNQNNYAIPLKDVHPINARNLSDLDSGSLLLDDKTFDNTCELNISLQSINSQIGSDINSQNINQEFHFVHQQNVPILKNSKEESCVPPYN